MPDGFRLHIVDLPGTYSLTAYSLEEVVARDFLVNQKPEVVINIVDASNLERNLYLAIQFLEMGVPICIALNMMDVAKNGGSRSMPKNFHLCWEYRWSRQLPAPAMAKKSSWRTLPESFMKKMNFTR